MNPVGDELVDAVAHRNQLTCNAACLNALFTINGLPARFFTIRALRPSMPTGRGELAQKPCAGQDARPARRTVPSCTRRAGLFARKNVAVGCLARAAQTRAPHIVDIPARLRQPRRYFTTLRFEMALRAADTLSRETVKTGLRPVGRAAVATFETGLRPVRSAPTGRVAISRHARPARRPVSGYRRRAGLFAPRSVAHPHLSRAAQTHPSQHVDPLRCLGQPHRYFSTLLLEMALRTAERSFRETAKTGLRPVGRAAVAAFETGLRPVGSARPDALSPIRTPEPGPPILLRVRQARAFPAGQAPPPARPSLDRTTEGPTWRSSSTHLPTRRWRAPAVFSCDAPPNFEELPNKGLHPTRAARGRVKPRSLGGCLSC
jgi:hypothetical protein